MIDSINRFEWIEITKRLPPLGVPVYFLWTDEMMYGHIETGHVEQRMLDGSIHLKHIFIGAIEPSHWFPVPEIKLPPLPGNSDL